jgi:hypothetical protein
MYGARSRPPLWLTPLKPRQYGRGRRVIALTLTHGYALCNDMSKGRQDPVRRTQQAPSKKQIPPLVARVARATTIASHSYIFELKPDI